MILFHEVIDGIYLGYTIVYNGSYSIRLNVYPNKYIKGITPDVQVRKFRLLTLSK